VTLYEAPSRADNWCGDRDFAYLAEVDILGWKFRKMADGGVIIDTPKVTLDQAGSNLRAVLSPGHVALVQALMALEKKQGPEVPDSWEDIGKVLQA
jgi:hypothetical protein